MHACLYCNKRDFCGNVGDRTKFTESRNSTKFGPQLPMQWSPVVVSKINFPYWSLIAGTCHPFILINFFCNKNTFLLFNTFIMSVTKNGNILVANVILLCYTCWNFPTPKLNLETARLPDECENQFSSTGHQLYDAPLKLTKITFLVTHLISRHEFWWFIS